MKTLSIFRRGPCMTRILPFYFSWGYVCFGPIGVTWGRMTR